MRLIDAEYNLHDLPCYFDFSDEELTAISTVLKLIQTADAVERKRGRWEWHNEDELYYSCSCCGHKAYGNTFEIIDGAYHFCPNCGAEMRTEINSL